MDAGMVGIFLTVVVAHFLALLSPGPDFVLIVKSAVKNESKTAIGVPLGIALANASYILLCLVGVGFILAASMPVMMALKVVGGVFLIYLAVQALRAKRSSYQLMNEQLNAGLSQALDAKSESGADVVANAGRSSFLREFVTGYMSGILNPKNLLFYLSLFTVVLTNDVSLSFKIGLAIWMTLVVFVWDTVILLLLTTGAVRRQFSKVAYYIDKVTGLILGAIGVTIVRSAFSQSSSV